MKMKKIIHEELGQELENIGFHYVSGERLFWPYEREKDGIKQEIMVVRDRYEKGYIKVIFHTNAYMQRPREFCDFVPEEGAKHWDFWGFDNEEELREVLKEFKRLIFTYGLDFLETISKPATEEVIGIIYKKMEEILVKPYTEVEDLLMGLAALYGDAIYWENRENWIWSEEEHNCQIEHVLDTLVNQRVLNLILGEFK